jgi:UDP-N-acetylmuramyl pentapeptide synthase
MRDNTEQRLVIGEKFRVWWDDREGIIRSESRGDFEEGDARRQIAEIHRIAESKPGRALVLNDMTEAGKASSGARKVYAQMLNSEEIAKHAFVGMRTLTRVIVAFLLGASGAGNAMFFATEKEAIKWLKADGSDR